MTRATLPASRLRPSGRLALLVVLGALSAFGPLSLDLYLPGMPGLSRQLATTDSLAQLTISVCMIGLAAGQLISGPLSDRIGRRIPLIVGVAVFVLASLGCAVAPSITVLLVARFVQGFAGAAGIVISRAVVRDLYDEKDAARVYSRLMAVTGVAPVVAPIAGGLLLLVTDWRGMFVALAIIGALLLLCAILVVPNSLAPENREIGGLGLQARQMAAIISNRTFMGYAISAGVAGCALFTYISMSSLVFQDQYDVSAQTFSLIFAVNSIGIVLASQLNTIVIKRLSLRRVLVISLVISVAAAAGMTVAGWVGATLLTLLVPLFVVVASQGFQGPNTTALALGPFARGAGAAAAVLGTLQFLVGAVVPPLVSLGGTNAVVMGLTMLVSGFVALLVLVGLTQSRKRSRRA